jgi:DUF1680 family protein
LEFNFDMTPRRIYSNHLVRDNSYMTAFQRGPIIYCAEEIDNGPLLHNLSVSDCKPAEHWRAELGGYMELQIPGKRITANSGKLYDYSEPAVEKTVVRLIPYCLWGNRAEGEMRVWLRCD